MKKHIKYGVDVIVGTLFQGEWKWYLTEKEIWILDQIKLKKQFRQLGYEVSNEMEPERKGIPILNEKTASTFLHRIDECKVGYNILQNMMIEKLPVSKWDDISEMFPSIFINFDKKELWSLFPELTSFENYVPDGWIGKYEDFYELIPIKERYWIIDGHDYIKDLADT